MDVRSASECVKEGVTGAVTGREHLTNRLISARKVFCSVSDSQERLHLSDGCSVSRDIKSKILSVLLISRKQ